MRHGYCVAPRRSVQPIKNRASHGGEKHGLWARGSVVPGASGTDGRQQPCPVPGEARRPAVPARGWRPKAFRGAIVRAELPGFPWFCGCNNVVPNITSQRPPLIRASSPPVRVVECQCYTVTSPARGSAGAALVSPAPDTPRACNCCCGGPSVKFSWFRPFLHRVCVMSETERSERGGASGSAVASAEAGGA